MSGKLDQSLDEIVSSHRRGAARGRGGRRGRPTRAVSKQTPAAPVGGIKKTHAPRGGAKAPTGPSGGRGESKILVSNLPKDVNEGQIKDYFNQSVGQIRKVDISYGPAGISRGSATIVFARPEGASKAVEVLNGVLVDGRPIKIDIILDAKRAADIPPPKGLSERITAPKAQPKSAAITKKTDGATRGAKGKRGRGGKSANVRQTKKTAEELDSEMVDYWATSGDGEANTGAAAPAAAANGDAPMEDEIL